MVSTIGLKIANGDFYPIVDENSQAKKRLVLTTVHDNQPSAQIDLYRSYTKTMADALYMGSLVMENIKPQPKGEPSIELIITSSRNGDITADAVDMDGDAKDERQSLNVSLRSLEEDNLGANIPDFELENDEADTDEFYGKTPKIETEDFDKRKFPWLLVVCAALIVTAIALAIWLFFIHTNGSMETAFTRFQQLTQGRRNERSAETQTPAVAPSVAQQPASVPPAVPPVTQQPAQLTAQPSTQPAAVASAMPQVTQQPAQPAPQVSQQSAQPAPPVPTSTPPVAQPPPQPAAAPPVTQPAARPAPPVIQAPAQAPAANRAPVSRVRAPPPVASYRVPSVIPREGVPYVVRYGDTLWDIAEAFYRNPWLYPRIARFNNIRNPDRIIAGTTIRVPPRN